MTPPLNPPAVTAWFDDRLQRFDAFLAQSGPDRARVCQQVLQQTARELVLMTQLDPRGSNFPMIIVLLTSSCRLLGVWPTTSDWQGALNDGAPSQAGSLIAFPALGINLTTQFKDWATHALIAAGVVPGVESDAPVDERRAMHELAVAYLMRLTVAYAAETQVPLEPNLVQFRYALFAA